MAAGSSSERCRLLVGGSVTRKAGWRRDTVNSGSGIRGRDARKAGAHDHEKSKEISTRQYLQIRERRGLVREILPHSRRPSEARSTRPNFRNRREASTGRVERHCRGIEQEPGARARSGACAEVCRTSVHSAEIRKRRLAQSQRAGSRKAV